MQPHKSARLHLPVDQGLLLRVVLLFDSLVNSVIGLLFYRDLHIFLAWHAIGWGQLILAVLPRGLVLEVLYLGLATFTTYASHAEWEHHASSNLPRYVSVMWALHAIVLPLSLTIFLLVRTCISKLKS